LLFRCTGDKTAKRVIEVNATGLGFRVKDFAAIMKMTNVTKLMCNRRKLCNWRDNKPHPILRRYCCRVRV
jgi:hypothetical protein